MLKELLSKMYVNNIQIYVILAFGIFGILSKLVLDIGYHRLLKESERIGSSENKLMKTIRLKFETCYKIKIGVNNVDIFVDKYVYNYKICGISLYTWENLCGQLITLCALIALGGGLGAYLTKCGENIVLSTLLAGAIAAVLLIAFEYLLNLPGKRTLLRVNMKDYLENNLKAKLENTYFTPEELEEYCNSYFNEKEKKQEPEAIVEEQVQAADSESQKIIDDILREYLV